MHRAIQSEGRYLTQLIFINELSRINKRIAVRCANAPEWNIAAKMSLRHLTALHVALSEFRSRSSRSLNTTICARSNVLAARVFCGWSSRVAQSVKGAARSGMPCQFGATFTEPANPHALRTKRQPMGGWDSVMTSSNFALAHIRGPVGMTGSMSGLTELPPGT